MSYYKTTKQEYHKVKKGGQEALDELINSAVAKALKDYKKPSISEEEVQAIKQSAYDDGYTKASERIKELEEAHDRELKTLSEKMNQIAKDSFNEGRKSQKEYLMKKEKEHIRQELIEERIAKGKEELKIGMMLGQYGGHEKEVENMQDAVRSAKAFTIAECVVVLKDHFWKKGYDQRLPRFLEEVIRLDEEIRESRARLDDICRFTQKYVEKIKED